jgi:PAS domain-containing protein
MTEDGIMNSTQFCYEILKNSQDCIYFIEVLEDSHFRMIEVNTQFEIEFGLNGSQCIGKDVGDFLGSDLAAILKINLQKCIDYAITLEGIIELDGPNGKQLYQSTFIPVKDHLGRINKIQIVKRKIARELIQKPSILEVGAIKSSLIPPAPKLKRVKGFSDMHSFKKHIEAMEVQLKEMIDIAPYAIVMIVKTRPIYVNQSALNLAEVDSFEEYIKLGPLSFIHPHDRRAVTNLIRKINLNEPCEKYQLSVTGISKHGFSKYLDLRFQVTSTGKSKLIQMVAFDISDEIEKEKNLTRLACYSLNMTQYNGTIKGIQKELDAVVCENHLEKGYFQNIFNTLKQNSNCKNNWGLFNQHFEDLHPDFFANLKIICPALTINDIKLCACIRLNFETKEIAQFFNVTPASIQKARVRLKKKFTVPENIDLRTLIESI